MNNTSSQGSNEEPIVEAQPTSDTQTADYSQDSTEEPIKSSNSYGIFHIAGALLMATLCAFVTGLGFCALSFYVADYLSGNLTIQLLILTNVLVPLATWVFVFTKALK